MSSFHISFTGCSRRQMDCERIKNYFIANSWELADSPKDANCIIVSTCGLSEYLEDRSVEKIKEACKYEAKIIVYGCLPAMNEKKIQMVFNGPVVVTKKIEDFDSIFPDFTKKFKGIPDANKVFEEPDFQVKTRIKKKIKSFDLYYFLKIYNMAINGANKYLRRNHIASASSSSKHIVVGNPKFLIDHNNQYFTLRISTGCLGTCSYCTIRKAIGRTKSKSIRTLLEELRGQRIKRSTRLNILSSDTGTYGLDIGSNLPKLLRAILNENSGITIHFIQDLHPAWICRYRKELVELIASRRIKSILTAVQSGSPKILKLMRRPANLDEYREALDNLKRVYPMLRLRTQVIIGFPNETEEDFQSTVSFLKKCKFDEVDIFHYHETPQMDSARLFPKVPHDIIESRIMKLMDSLPISVTMHYHKKL